MDQALIERLIFWGLWGLVMAIVMGWLARSRFGGDENSDGKTLEHPTSTLIIGIVCAAFFVGIEILSIIFDNGSTNIFTHTIFVTFALAGLVVVLQYCFEKHRLIPGGLQFTRYTGGRSRFNWSDVIEIRYDPVWKWFWIKSKNGDIARISAYLKGLGGFARVALTQLPPSAIDDETANILNDTALGAPPKLWD